MFLWVYFMGWVNRALWRVGIHTNSTAPSLYTAWRVYGIRPKPRVWVDDWCETGWDCFLNDERVPYRSRIAWYLKAVGI